jgi:predicted adenine nucleotide alpha hydrolase (AANH) superfamily ATPase
MREEGLEVMAFFYRHNIHPYSECLRRQEALEAYAEQIDLKVIYQKGYDLEGFIRNVAFRESERCNYCYHDRLRSTALLAKRGKFDYFSSTPASQWASPFFTMIIGKAGRKGSNVQSKWGSTGSITAGVFTVKRNAFSKNSFIGLIGFISSIG